MQNIENKDKKGNITKDKKIQNLNSKTKKYYNENQIFNEYSADNIPIIKPIPIRTSKRGRRRKGR